MSTNRRDAKRAGVFYLLLLPLVVLGCRTPADEIRTIDRVSGTRPEPSSIQQVQFFEPVADSTQQTESPSLPPLDAGAPSPPGVGPSDIYAEPIAPDHSASSEEMLPDISTDVTGRYPIDLPTALRLAGANNLQIALARERVFEAQSRLDAADVLWVPSLGAGVMYNKHDGRLQATEGDVQEVSRNSLFVGGGPVLSNAPLTGGAGGPRLFVDLSLADVYFEPLAAQQSVQAADAGQSAVFNDTLLEVTTAYLGLVNAQAAVAIANEAVTNAGQLVQITEGFARSGAGLEADSQRARADLASRQRTLYAAEENLAVVSAELSRLLRLDASVILFAADEEPVPLEMIDEDTPLPVLIGQGLAARPEVRAASAQIEGTYARLRQEEVRTWLPYLFVGYSAGGFGGGTGSSVDNFAGRGDLDAGAVWSWENFGFGNLARQREQESIYNQAQLTSGQVRDRVAIEVAQAYRRVQSRRQQIAASRTQVVAAADAFQLNLAGIEGLTLRPIEAQQAIGALASARQQYVDAVIDYDRAQFELLRAIGQPPIGPQN